MPSNVQPVYVSYMASVSCSDAALWCCEVCKHVNDITFAATHLLRANLQSAFSFQYSAEC